MTGAAVRRAAVVALLAGFGTLGSFRAFAADTSGAGEPRVVFHVNEAGEQHWESVLGNVEHLREALGAANTEVEVVAHGEGIGLVMATNAALAGRMKRLSEEGVVFDACENTMRSRNVTKEELLPFAITVDSGIAHVVRRQEQGWAYVKP